MLNSKNAGIQLFQEAENQLLLFASKTVQKEKQKKTKALPAGE
jgi:hypothetical protein